MPQWLSISKVRVGQWPRLSCPDLFSGLFRRIPKLFGILRIRGHFPSRFHLLPIGEISREIDDGPRLLDGH